MLYSIPSHKRNYTSDSCSKRRKLFVPVIASQEGSQLKPLINTNETKYNWFILLTIVRSAFPVPFLKSFMCIRQNGKISPSCTAKYRLRFLHILIVFICSSFLIVSERNWLYERFARISKHLKSSFVLLLSTLVVPTSSSFPSALWSVFHLSLYRAMESCLFINSKQWQNIQIDV